MKKLNKFLALLCSIATIGATLASCDVLQGVLDSFPSLTPPESSVSNPAINPEEEAKKASYSYYPVVSEKMPVININTPDKSNEWVTKYGREDKFQDRIEYVDATVGVSNCDTEYQLSDIEAEVKVRGNATLEYPKKPIRIKFKKKNNILGLHDGEKYKNWVLLANWKDLSMANNIMGFYFGNTVLGSDGYYCTDFRNVEVYLNGEYWGVYLLVEQQEAKDGRSSVPEVEDDYTGTDIGYFFEYDGYYKKEIAMPNNAGDPTFVMNQGGGRYNYKGYTIKNDIYDDGQITFLKNYMDNAYTIIYEAINNNIYYKFNNDFTAIEQSDSYTSSKEAVSAVLDIQSLVDTYILNEIACDLDVDWSSFYLSLNMTAEGNKKITFEAPWDWDSAFGIAKNMCNDAQGLYALNKGNPWFNLIKPADWFHDMVSEKWAELKKYGVIAKAFSLLEDLNAKYSGHFLENSERWPDRATGGNGELIDELNSYNVPQTAQILATNYLKNWLTKRISYLDSVWTKVVVNENLPENASVYKFEAENAVFNGFTTESIRTNKSFASGNAYVGDPSEGRSLTFYIGTERATTAYLFIGVSKLKTSGDATKWYSTTINGTPLPAPTRIVPAISNGEDAWHTFVSIKIAPVQLKAGENVITLTTGSSSSNIDYIELYSAEELYNTYI